MELALPSTGVITLVRVAPNATENKLSCGTFCKLKSVPKETTSNTTDERFMRGKLRDSSNALEYEASHAERTELQRPAPCAKKLEPEQPKL